MKQTISLLFSCFLVLTLAAQNDIETRLFDLPDVRFKKIDTPEGFAAAYELRIKQPIDHKNPAVGHFYQRVFLTHKGFEQATVMATEGYNRGKNRMYELTRYLDANQLDIEHRYFGESVPDELNYKYLTLEQATADLHHINELFRQIYTGKWLSTGISKGGQTTIFYRYFYPEDVDVSVPYVAPLNLAFEDERIYSWLESAGNENCRQAIYDIQIRLLQDRSKAMPLLRWYAKGANLDFTYMTIEEAYEYAILEYPFSFFQWGSDCEKMPAADAPFEEVLQHFIDVVGISFYSDKDVQYFASHYYQAATQMGYYGFETAKFKGLLKSLSYQPHPHAAFTPTKQSMRFDDRLINATAKWLEAEGNEFIYIYGKDDTWSATGVPPSKKTNSLWVIMEGKHHGNARIANMTDKNQEKVEDKLEEWLEVEEIKGIGKK